MSPAPAVILKQLALEGKLTLEECQLAEKIPLSCDITVEADSGGHTDNGTLGALFPRIMSLARQLQARYQFAEQYRIGAAGGIGDPQSAAAAFALGADYILTGTINQAAIEARLSAEGKKLLAQADIADTVMAPAADMFEMGVELQVLRRGTFFSARAKQLYQLYKQYSGIDAIPLETRERIEKQIFQQSLDSIWQTTFTYFRQRDPSQIERAQKDPKHQMALIFRWYLGMASRWAIEGEASRVIDYQIWCGQAMGAFNHWVKGSFLEDLSNRSVKQIGLNIMIGAAFFTRLQHVRALGLTLPNQEFYYKPHLIKEAEYATI
jgi:PfaD family protein